MVTKEEAYKFGFEEGREAVWQVLPEIKKKYRNDETYIAGKAKDYAEMRWWLFDEYIGGELDDDEFESDLWEKYHEGIADGIARAIEDALEGEEQNE